MNLNQGAEFKWLAVNNIVMLCMVLWLTVEVVP